MTVEYLATSDLSDDTIGNYLLTLAAQAPGAGNREPGNNYVGRLPYAVINWRKAAVKPSFGASS